MSRTILDLCQHLIDEEDWIEVWAVSSHVPARGFGTSTDYNWTHTPLRLVPAILNHDLTSNVLHGACAPDHTMILWSGHVKGIVYLENAVLEMLSFMRCQSILGDESFALTPLEIEILRDLKPDSFFEDIAAFFCKKEIPPMILSKDLQWQALPQRRQSPPTQ